MYPSISSLLSIEDNEKSEKQIKSKFEEIDKDNLKELIISDIKIYDNLNTQNAMV